MQHKSCTPKWSRECSTSNTEVWTPKTDCWRVLLFPLVLALLLSCLAPTSATATDPKAGQETLVFRSVLSVPALATQNTGAEIQANGSTEPQPIKPDSVKFACGDSRNFPSGTPGAEVTYKFPANSTDERNGTNCCRWAENQCLAKLKSWLQATSPDAICKSCGSCQRCGAKLTGCESFKHMSLGTYGECTWYGHNPVNECSYKCIVEKEGQIEVGCSACQHPDESVGSQPVEESSEASPSVNTQSRW